MADDPRNFIEQTLARAEIVNGAVPSPDDLATTFAKLGETERVDALERIGSDLAGSDLSVRQAADLHSYSRVLKHTHETLRKVGR
jgi:hypothetical protein